MFSGSSVKQRMPIFSRHSADTASGGLRRNIRSTASFSFRLRDFTSGDVDIFTFADSSKGSLNFDGAEKYILPLSVSIALESWVAVAVE